MAYEIPLFTVPFQMDAASTAHQFKLMKLSTDGQALIQTTVAGTVIGVLQNNPAAANRNGSLVILGITKVKAKQGTVAIAMMDKLKCSTAGLAIRSTNGVAEYIFGRALETLSTGTSTVTITCLMTHEGRGSTA